MFGAWQILFFHAILQHAKVEVSLTPMSSFLAMMQHIVYRQAVSTEARVPVHEDFPRQHTQSACTVRGCSDMNSYTQK